MRPTEDLLALIPAQLHTDKLRCTWHNMQKTWYVYWLDGVVYDPQTKHCTDKRKRLGKIKDGVWSYSPSYLKDLKIEQLQKELQTKKQDVVDERLAKSSSVCAMQKLKSQTALVPDPRQSLKITYRLDHVLIVTCLAMLGGYSGALSIADYWSRHRYELSKILDDFPQEDISHDTINRLMRLIQPEDFLNLMSVFTFDMIKQHSQRVVHVDGKAVRASKTEDAKSGRYLLNAFDSGSRMFIAHELIGAKNNEITVAIDLLKKLELKPGDFMTADAMHTQKATVAYLHSIGVGYCLCAKDNQETLSKEIMRHFAGEERKFKRYAPEPECDHDRIEIRETEIMPGSILSKSLKEQWAGLAQGCIVKSVTRRMDKKGQKEGTLETRYFICSMPYKEQDSEKKVAHLIRSHWSIENSLHWVLDVVFGEDRVHATDANYINNRSMCLKASANVLRAVQSTLQQRGQNISINRLKEMCSTPLESLDILGQFFSHGEIPYDVKD